MNLSTLRQILASGGIRLTRSLGQNFLHDANQLNRIVRAADLSPADRVLEIGPGLGALTERLLPRCGELLAIEKDRRLFDWLAEHYAGARHLTLLHADALEYLCQTPRDWSDWKVAANLPYSVASPILIELAAGPGVPGRLTITVQQEVADRLTAKPGAAGYSLLTLFVQLRYQPLRSFRIPAACFFPAPDIGSACVTLVRRPLCPLGEKERNCFRAIVRRSFSQRRKMMFKLLKADWPADRVRGAFRQLDLRPETRAEDVALDQFIALTRLLCD